MKPNDFQMNALSLTLVIINCDLNNLNEVPGAKFARKSNFSTRSRRKSVSVIICFVHVSNYSFGTCCGCLRSGYVLPYHWSRVIKWPRGWPLIGLRMFEVVIRVRRGRAHLAWTVFKQMKINLTRDRTKFPRPSWFGHRPDRTLPQARYARAQLYLFSFC